jgi:hypothetical protein
LTVAEYESVRLIPTQFLVLPGHVLNEVERVVEQIDRFVVVDMFGVAGLVAVEHDPRAKLPLGAPENPLGENEALRERLVSFGWHASRGS